MRKGLRKRVRGLVLSIAALVMIGGCYGIAAVTLSRIPINTDFLEDPAGIPIAVVDNGVHVDILTPVFVAGHDWRRVLPEGGVPPVAVWLGFGWGSRDFYLNTPTWADFSLWSGAKALAGVGGTTVRVHSRKVLLKAPNVTVLRLAPDQYMRLVAAIEASMALDVGGKAIAIPAPGYGDDVFLEGEGRYSPFLTCNEWASRMLAAAGIRTAFWSPFPNGVTLQND